MIALERHLNQDCRRASTRASSGNLLRLIFPLYPYMSLQYRFTNRRLPAISPALIALCLPHWHAHRVGPNLSSRVYCTVSQRGAHEPRRLTERPVHQEPSPPQTDPLVRCIWCKRAPLWILRFREDISDRAAEPPRRNAQRTQGPVRSSGPPHAYGAGLVRLHPTSTRFRPV